MEYEIDDCDTLFDASTNPSLVRHRRSSAGRKAPLHSWNRPAPAQKALVIPEEEEQLV